MILFIKGKSKQIYLALREKVIGSPPFFFFFFGKLGSVSPAEPVPDHCQTCWMKKSLKSNLGSKVLENNTSCHDLKKQLKTETLKCICLERVTKLFVRLLGFRTPVNHSERHCPQMEKTWNSAKSSQQWSAYQN